MSLRSKVAQRVRRPRHTAGFAQYYADAQYTTVNDNGYIEASLETRHGGSTGFLTNIIDGVSSTSLVAKTYPDVKFGVSVSLDVNRISHEPPIENKVYITSEIVKLDAKLVQLDCKVYGDDKHENMLAQGTHIKFIV